MDHAPERYRRHDLPDFDCRQSGDGKNLRQPWVEALPGLGFVPVFDEVFITVESQLSWLHDTQSGKGASWRREPQKLWIQVWRHDAGALSSIVRFSEGGDKWMYSSVDLLAEASHGFCSTNPFRGARVRNDGSVACRIEGDDRTGASPEDTWAVIQQMAKQGRLLPLDQWDAIPLPNHTLEAIMPEWQLPKRLVAKIDAPASRYNTCATIISNQGTALLQAWAQRIDAMPKVMSDAEKSLWLEQMKIRLEISFKRCPTPLAARREKDPAMRELVSEMSLRNLMAPYEYRHGLLVAAIQRKLVDLLRQAGMTERDPLTEPERNVTQAWLQALAEDPSDDPTPTATIAPGMALSRFGLRFDELLLAAAREEGVVNKIKTWIEQQSDDQLVQACTISDKHGISLPMHLARAWLQAVNSGQRPEEERERIMVVRQCYALLAKACPIEQWSWVSHQASVWDCATGEAINLPHDDDLVAPHQERLGGFCQWLQANGARVTSVIFIPGQVEPVDLLDAEALAGAMERAIKSRHLSDRGSPAERIDLMAPLTSFLVQRDMHERVGPADELAPARTGIRF